MTQFLSNNFSIINNVIINLQTYLFIYLFWYDGKLIRAILSKADTVVWNEKIGNFKGNNKMNL